jgi:hypothetical protein
VKGKEPRHKGKLWTLAACLFWLSLAFLGLFF